MKNRLSTLACTSSIGPGATNMVTGAALATINRLPVLLLPGDVFATRAPGTVLQELEDASTLQPSRSTTRCGRSRKFWDRIERPEQLVPALLAAMRVLTDPAETGAVTLALPQDVQAEAFDWPEELFEKRVWRVRRPVPEPDVLAQAAELLRGAREAADRVRRRHDLRRGHRRARRVRRGHRASPSPRPRRARARSRTTTRRRSGAIGATGTTAANAAAREADVILGVGTRWSDFTTASRSLFDDDVASSTSTSPPSTRSSTPGCRSSPTRGSASRRSPRRSTSRFDDAGERLGRGRRARLHARATTLPAQSEVIGVVNRVSAARATSSSARRARMPGDLHKLWRTRDPKGYHVEYGYSTMGYEIAGGLGVKMAAPDREVFVMVGDGSYLMMAQEIVTAVAEGIKLTIVLVQNHGYQSIGALSRVGRLAALRHRVPLPWNGREAAGRPRRQRRVSLGRARDRHARRSRSSRPRCARRSRPT